MSTPVPKRWLTRVHYHLPAGNGSDYPKSKTFRAYLDVLDSLQSMPEVKGYSETEASGFWRDEDGTVYFDEVRVITVDYPDSQQGEDLDTHITGVRKMIATKYAIHGCPQLEIYVLAQDLLRYV